MLPRERGFFTPLEIRRVEQTTVWRVIKISNIIPLASESTEKRVSIVYGYPF